MLTIKFSGSEIDTFMAGQVSIVAIVKGEERYIFMFDDNSRSETLRTLGRYASNPDLSFSWYDAAVLSQKVRQTRSTEEVEADLAQQQMEDADWHGNRASISLDHSGPESLPGPINPADFDFDFESPDMWIGDDPINP